MRRQSHVRIVLAEQQSIFRARRHHSIRLIGSLRHQIVDQHTDICLRAFEHQRFIALDHHRRVDPRHQSLRRRLLISRRSVRLPRREQPVDHFELERRLQLQRIDAIILDRIARTHDLRPLEPGDRVQKFDLHVHGHARRHALHIILLRSKSLRLEKQLMTILVGEPNDLRLDRRTISRSDPFDHSVRHRRPVQVSTEYLMRPLVRVRQITVDRVANRLVGHERKALRLSIALLQLHLRKVERTTVDARGSPRLESHQSNAEIDQ